MTSTKAIILTTTRTADEKIILRTLTSDYGRVDCVVYGARGKRNGHKAAQIFPMSMVDIVMDYRPARDLQIVKDMSPSYTMLDTLSTPLKSSIAMFMGEVLSKVVHKGDDDRNMFEFCLNSAIALENAQTGVENFHIAMLVHLAGYLGVWPVDYKDVKCMYYDMKYNVSTIMRPPHPQYLTPSEAVFMRQLLRINYRNMGLFVMNREQRRDTIDRILLYYKIHLPSIGDIASRRVLEEYYDF